MNVYDLLIDCVVHVQASEVAGTGFFVSPGLIMTCAHVVSSSSQITITQKGNQYPASIQHVSPDSYPDLAILRIDFFDHPCVMLDQHFEPGDELHIYGFPRRDLYNKVESGGLHGICEGKSYLDEAHLQELITFRSTNVVPGLSGSPVMNIRTQRVCGIVTRTRDEATTMGGRAVPTRIMFTEIPNLEHLQTDYHAKNSLWTRVSRTPMSTTSSTAIDIDYWLYKAKQLCDLPSLSSSIRIDRPEMMTQLTSFANQGSGIIVGDAGVGKTYSMRQLGIQLINAGTPCIYLSIADLNNWNDLNVLPQTQSIATERDLGEYIRQLTHAFSGINPIMLLDAFDAASSPTKRSVVLKIADTAKKSNANVLITTRLYDAENSVQLRQLFPVEDSQSIPTTYQAESIPQRHFLIPRLSSEELESVLLEIPTLLALSRRCGPNLQELLRVPFNLMLVDILRQENPDALNMGCVSSEVELLDLYWKYRVWETEHRHYARLLIRKICSQIVDERTSLVNIDNYIDTPEHLETIEYLCSVQILAYQPGSQQRLSFVHKLLFDYIVSVLLIPEDVEQFVVYFSADRTRTVYLIPSARYYFARLWLHDRTLFWRIVLYPTSSDTERHLKLFVSFLPPRLIVETVQTAEELSPLIEAVDRKEAQAFLGVRALLKMAVYVHHDESFSCDEGKVTRTIKTVGDEFRSSLWLNFIDALLPFASPEIGVDMATMAKFILDSTGDLHIQRLSQFSHRIFEWSFSQIAGEQANWHQWFLDRHVVTLLTLTYAASPDLTRASLMTLVEGMATRTVSLDVVRRLILNFDNFMNTDPEFVGTVYTRIFGHTEDSDEKTHMGGIIIPMSSTRRQDFQGLQYLLVNKFPEFLELFPLVAVHTMAKSLNSYLSSQRSFRLRDEEAGTFTIRDRSASFVPVHHLGHRSGNPEIEPEYMADLVFEYLLTLSKDNERYGLFVEIIDTLLENIEASYLWGALIEVSTQNAEVFSRFLFELLIAQPIIDNYEVYHKLRSFISIAAEHLTVRQLRAIEERLLAEREDKLTEREKRDREILVASIPPDLLQTEEAKRVCAYYQEGEGLPPNRAPVSFGGVTSRALTDFDWAEEVGVDLNTQDNDNLRSKWLPIQRLIKDWANKQPDKDVWLAEFQHAQEFHQQLHSQTLKADEEVITKAWTELAEYVETLSRFSSELDDKTFEFCRQVMLECAANPDPIFDPERDKAYDSAHWWPAPRIEAAQGLIRLAHRLPDIEVEMAIESLSQDKVTPIRFLIAHNLIFVFSGSETLFWKIIQERALHENNDVVWQGILHSLEKVRGRHEAEAIIQSQMKEKFDQTSELVFKYLIPLTLWYTIDQEHEWATNVIEQYISNPLRYPEQLSQVNTGVHSWIKPEHLLNDSKQVSQRAIGKLKDILQSAFVGIETILPNDKRQLSEQDQETLRSLSIIIENTVSWLLIDLGLRAKDSPAENDSPEETSHFYFAVKPILSYIASASNSRASVVLSAYASHNFIEILNGMLDADPSDVFHMAAQMVEASQKSGYQFDSLAVREVVKLVCKALADHKYLFVSESNLDDLVTILDVFYQAGWPEAFYLVGRLDQIFE